MTPLLVISDASALIALDEIDLLERLQPLFAECVITPGVAAEIAPTVERPSWISVRSLGADVPQAVRNERLGHGETEVIALALETPGYDVVLDEKRARRLATGLGLSLIGTLGLLVRAKDFGILTEIRPSVEELLAKDFFLSARIVEEALREVGEQ